eukprot:COSAG01_NODE_49_length_31891_cov_29.945773_3_plen_146_part_00
MSQLDQAVDGWMACSTSTTNTSCACDTRRSSGGFRSALKFYYDAAPSGARDCRLLSAAEVGLGTAALTNWAAGSGEDTHWYARPAAPTHLDAVAVAHTTQSAVSIQTVGTVLTCRSVRATRSGMWGGMWWVARRAEQTGCVLPCT